MTPSSCSSGSLLDSHVRYINCSDWTFPQQGSRTQLPSAPSIYLVEAPFLSPGSLPGIHVHSVFSAAKTEPFYRPGRNPLTSLSCLKLSTLHSTSGGSSCSMWSLGFLCYIWVPSPHPSPPVLLFS